MGTSIPYGYSNMIQFFNAQHVCGVTKLILLFAFFFNRKNEFEQEIDSHGTPQI